MWEFRFLPPGRGLWMMGTDYIYERGSAALNNCAFVSTEEISFNFARIKTTYTQQNRTDGQAGGNIVGGWDRTANKVFA